MVYRARHRAYRKSIILNGTRVVHFTKHIFKYMRFSSEFSREVLKAKKANNREKKQQQKPATATAIATKDSPQIHIAEFTLNTEKRDAMKEDRKKNRQKERKRENVLINLFDKVTIERIMGCFSRTATLPYIEAYISSIKYAHSNDMSFDHNKFVLESCAFICIQFVYVRACVSWHGMAWHECVCSLFKVNRKEENMKYEM